MGRVRLVHHPLGGIGRSRICFPLSSLLLLTSVYSSRAGASPTRCSSMWFHEWRRASPALGPLAAALSIGRWIGSARPFTEDALLWHFGHLPTVAIEALQKERDDTLGATENARREFEEERLAATTAENVRDTAQAEAARLREELRSMVVPFASLFPSVLHGPCLQCPTLTPLVFVGAESMEEVLRLTEQLHEAWEEACSLRAHLES